MSARLCHSDFRPLSPSRRRRIEATIEALLVILDEEDGDPDLEPYLSGLHAGRNTDDREADYCYGTGGGEADREPSLGWTARGAMGKESPPAFGPDLEADDSDDEPPLGWTTAHDQISAHRFGALGILDGELDAGELPESGCVL